ncbi:MAG: iron-sulfur cluster assembly scaffold protein, partial [Patescibacteria group bacterium]
MSNTLYREELLAEYKDPYHFEKRKKYTHSASSFNAFCGDKVEVYLSVRKNVIKEAYFYGSGCVISTASASMLMSFVENKKIADVLKINQKDVIRLLNVSLTPTRLKCALLSLETIH